MFRKFFEGWYFKHQNESETVSIIPGISASGAFIQIITDESSYNINFPISEFKKGKKILVGNSIFSLEGIKLDIKTKKLNIQGEIFYHDLAPLKNDIMGPFRFFPLECRHGIISMHHRLDGKLQINGRIFDFTNGTGYIEKDSGHSFPPRYCWVHSNDFGEKCSVTVAIADIPFFGFHFQGLICAVYYKGKEYRIATYNKGKVLECTGEKVIVAGKDLRLEIYLSNSKSHALRSPVKGEMAGIIKEAPSCTAKFKFFKSDDLIFNFESRKTSCEFFGY